MSESIQPQAAAAVASEDYLARYAQRTPGSKALYDQARRVTPGGISHNHRYHAPYPIYFDRAKGCKLWDVDGNEYIDLWMAHYDAILGHAPEPIVKRLQEAMNGGLHVGLAMEHEIRLGERVCDLVPGAEQVRFCTSGTEATMYAVRLARGFTGRNVILKIKGGWHGANTDLMVDVAAPEFIGAEGMGLLPQLAAYTRSVEYNDIADTARAIAEAGDDWAGSILEPAVGAAGFIPVEQEYLAFLKEEARKAGAVIIFDEVITGFRLGLGGAQEYFNFTPDLATYGKVLGGGMPIGAIAGRADILSLSSVERKVPKAEKLVIGGGTYSTNPLTMICGIATLDALKAGKDEIYPTIAKRNARLCEGVKAAFDRVGIPVHVTQVGSLQEVQFVKEAGLPVRSMGDVLANTYPDKKVELAARLRNHGVFLFHGGAISMAHQDGDIATLLAAYVTCAEEMAEGA
ncbi:MAG: aspartate aminotransferase family protein [SAR324 cluster bacterium]|nr:aspartate aminotransferase family protein [SAR324 cluster bacterium]